MKKSTPLKTQRTMDPQDLAPFDQSEGTRIADDGGSSDSEPANDGTKVNGGVELENETEEQNESFPVDPFADGSFGSYAEALNADVEAFPSLSTPGHIESERTGADQSNFRKSGHHEGFAQEAPQSEPNAESVVPWATSSFPEEDSLSGREPRQANTSAHASSGGNHRSPERDVVGLSSSAEEAHEEFGPQAFSEPGITNDANGERDEAARNAAETAPSGQTLEDSERRESGAFRNVSVDDPLYPLEQEDHAGSHQLDHPSSELSHTVGSEEQFTLPQSLEEASVLLGKDSSFDITGDGPEIMLSEPDFQEFGQMENSHAQRAEAESRREHLASLGADTTRTQAEFPPEDVVSQGVEGSPVETLALSPSVQSSEKHGVGSAASEELDSDEGPAEPLQRGDLVTFRVVIESRNTRTREVLMTEEEFNLAERQILEDRKVHISGKALVLDAVAITKVAPHESRRRRRSSAA